MISDGSCLSCSLRTDNHTRSTEQASPMKDYFEGRSSCRHNASDTTPSKQDIGSIRSLYSRSQRLCRRP